MGRKGWGEMGWDGKGLYLSRNISPGSLRETGYLVGVGLVGGLVLGRHFDGYSIVVTRFLFCQKEKISM